MDKLFGTDEACHMCNRIPSIGFIYACQQDNPQHQHAPELPKSPKSRNRATKVKNRKAPNELEMLGFGESVVKAAAAGHYTKQQLQKLKAQKRAVADTVVKALQDNEDLKARQGAPPLLLAEKLAALEIKPEPDERNQTLFKETRSRHKPKKSSFSKAIQPCEFKVCHTCRPFSRDRTFVSFEAVFADEVTMPRAWSPEYMPIADVAVLRNLNYICDMTDSSEEEEADYQSDLGNTPPDSGIDGIINSLNHGSKTPDTVLSSASSTYGFRTSWQKNLQDMLGKHGVLPRDSTTSFNVDLWKSLSNEELAKAAATKLPESQGDDDMEETQEAAGYYVQRGLQTMHEVEEEDAPTMITSV